MTNAEIITALRNCADYSDCGICKLNGKFNCADMMMRYAADALEAADEKIADYTAAIDALDDSNDIKENERLRKRIAKLEEDIIYWQTYASEIER